MFGIMRTEKRGRTDVYGVQIEANRTVEQHNKNGVEFDRSDIDWERTPNNIFLKRTEKWNETITERLKEIEKSTGRKTRKDAVVLIDGLFTASPEFFEGKSVKETRKYFEDCLRFYVDEFCQGDDSRLLNAVIHLDEKTPHMQVASIPIITTEVGERLNAKTLMGGQQDYRLRQDRFYEAVSKHYGLERGEVREQAEIKAHTTKREWQLATLDESISKQKAAYQKNSDILNQQKDTYNKNSEILIKQKQEFEDVLERANEVIEAIDKVKVKKVSDMFNSDTINVDRESYNSIMQFRDEIKNDLDIIKEAENLPEKRRELNKLKAEKTRTELDYINIKNEYEQIKEELGDAKDKMNLTIENARLKRDNIELKEENKKLTKALNKIEELLNDIPIPDAVKNGIERAVEKLSDIQSRHRGRSI